MSRRIELGGEVREVAVLFVDVIGSTTLAATRPPTEVVDLLNRFFGVVVAEVTEHGGLVNKFEGDAALAVFGAPTELPDAAGRALAAARAMGRRLREEVPECQAGIGVSAGPAVAGNVGAESRFEYTVIGDPVNEAARLTELAKSVPGRIVASMRAVSGAAPGEAVRWRESGRETLRGRTEVTRLAVPC
jgi:adenylate cyclase